MWYRSRSVRRKAQWFAPLFCPTPANKSRQFTLSRRIFAWHITSAECTKKKLSPVLMKEDSIDIFAPPFIGGFHVTSSPPCWWTANKRSLISSFCLSTSICSFHHCYLCLPRLHENHLFENRQIEQPNTYKSLVFLEIHH